MKREMFIPNHLRLIALTCNEAAEALDLTVQRVYDVLRNGDSRRKNGLPCLTPVQNSVGFLAVMIDGHFWSFLARRRQEWVIPGTCVGSYERQREVIAEMCKGTQVEGLAILNADEVLRWLDAQAA